MSLHRGRMRPYFHLRVFYLSFSLFQFVYCNESSLAEAKLPSENLLERNDGRDNERYMLEKLLSNDNPKKYEDGDDDIENKKKYIKRNSLENEKDIIKKLLSLKSVYEDDGGDDDNADLEIKKRLCKKNFLENQDKIYQTNMRNLYNDENSRRYSEIETSDKDDDNGEIKKRLLKKKSFPKIFPEINLLRAYNFNDADVDDDSTDDYDGSNEVIKRFSKKNLNEAEDENAEFKKRSLKKRIDDDEIDNEDLELKKRLSKKNIYTKELSDDNEIEFKKRLSKKDDNKENGDQEFKKRLSKKVYGNEEVNDPELRKKFSKQNDDHGESRDPEFKYKLSKKDYGANEDEDSELRKRFSKISDDHDDSGNPEVKKRYSKKSYSATVEFNNDPDAMNRESIKNYISRQDTDTHETDLRKTLKYNKRKRYNEHSLPYVNVDDTVFQSSQSDGNLPILKLLPQALIHDVILDRNDTHHLYWQVDYKSESVRMEVHSRAISPHPWMSIGFSDRGDLPGGDVCVFWIDWKNHVHFQNAFIDNDGRLVASPTQECRDFRFRFVQGVLKLTFTRRFDTCKANHYVIERGTTHIIWSWGEGPLYDLDGVLAEGDDNGMVRLELLKPLLVEPPLEGTEEIDITSHSAIVPAEETTYWCTVHKLPERLEEKHHIFKFGPKIQKRNEDIVHHIEVFHCEHPPDFQVPLYEGPCHADDRPKEIDACKRVLAAWAMGALPFTYPEEAGLPFGGDDFNPFVMLEVHYNNPGLIAGKVDSSGMTLTYSRQLRRHDAAIMELGLEYTAKMAIPPRMKRFYLEGYCIPECTAVGLDPDGIFIFGSQLHTHLTGIRAWTKHYRGNEELPELNRDNHYSTHFQEIRRLPSLAHVLPGDSLITTCEHTTLDRAEVTVGGFAISDEMCINYVHYYPKSDLEVCKSSVDSKTLMNYFQRLKRLELQNTSSNFDWRGNYQSIQWTPLRGDFLQELYNESPLSMQCNKSSGERFPGFWENKSKPMVSHPLPVPRRECNLRDHFRLNEEIIIV